MILDVHLSQVIINLPAWKLATILDVEEMDTLEGGVYGPLRSHPKTPLPAPIM